MNQEEILRKAMQIKGREHQKGMLMEELGELMSALNKLDRGRDSVDHIAEELADVLIMLEEWMLELDCVSDVYRWHNIKLLRLAERLGLAEPSE